MAEFDDDVGHFGRMRIESRSFGIGPACQVHDDTCLLSRFALLGRFDDVETGSVDEERVIAEAFA